jgi:hypothetical protein
MVTIAVEAGVASQELGAIALQQRSHVGPESGGLAVQFFVAQQITPGTRGSSAGEGSRYLFKGAGAVGSVHESLATEVDTPATGCDPIQRNALQRDD